MKKELICLSCPLGCRLTAEQDAAGEWQISGNKCPRGIVYARNELTDPRRIITAVVRSNSELMPYIPVRTDQPLPRRMASELLNRLYQMTVEVPVKCDEILLDNVEGTGIKVIYSCDCTK